jgi:hypothetical protein
VSTFEAEDELLGHLRHPAGRRYLPHLHPAHHPQRLKILPMNRYRLFSKISLNYHLSPIK